MSTSEGACRWSFDIKKLEALRRHARRRKHKGLYVLKGGGRAAALAKAAGKRRLAAVPSDEDWRRLEDSEGLLNDALLDFCLPRLVALSRCADRVHAFSALFYTQLALGGWNKVNRWTRPLRQESMAGVFAKDFLFVPAHDKVTGHWWLALVVHPWAAGQLKGCMDSLQPFTPGHHKTFVAILDSIDPIPRLSASSTMNPEDAEVAAQAMAAAGPRHSEALKLIKEYLEKEWADCFQGAAGYDAQSIQGVSLAVPQQTNETDCGVFVLEFARRMLDDPNILEYVCENQASPPQLSAPASGQLRCKWRRLGERLANDAKGGGRAIATPARSVSACPDVHSDSLICGPEVCLISQEEGA